MDFPIEITRIIYTFLGYFPCQKRLIPLKEVHKHIEKSVDWLSSLFVKLYSRSLFVNREKKYYILDRNRKTVILDEPAGWNVWEIEDDNISWRNYYLFFP